LTDKGILCGFCEGVKRDETTHIVIIHQKKMPHPQIIVKKYGYYEQS